MVNRTLVIVAHPHIDDSRVNAAMASALSGLDHVTVYPLFAANSSFKFDVAKEQSLLLEHDVIVFQFPLYWYSVPGILKEWMDQVLLRGFAYGGVNKLKGKKLIVAVSTGSKAGHYTEQGLDHITLDNLLAPLKTTALRVKMSFEKPFYTYDVRGLTEEDLKSVCLNYRNFINHHSNCGNLLNGDVQVDHF